MKKDIIVKGGDTWKAPKIKLTQLTSEEIKAMRIAAYKYLLP